MLKPYALVNQLPVLADGKTLAREEQIKAKEAHINNYDKQKYLDMSWWKN